MALFSTQLTTVLAQAQVKATDAAAPAESSSWLLWGHFLAILIVPPILSWLIAKGMKLSQEHRTKTTWVLFALFVALTPFTHRMLTGVDPREAFKLGVDLAGGANLVFEIDIDKIETKDGEEIITDVEFDQMLDAIRRRVNPSGTEEVTVRRVGPYRFEVIVPDVTTDEVEVIKRRISRLGELEFAILAKPGTDDTVIGEAKKLDDSVDNFIENDRLMAGWRDLARTPGGKPKDVPSGNDSVTRTVKREFTKKDGTTTIEDVTQFLCLFEPEERRVTGKYLRRVFPEQDGANLAVGFIFNTSGGHLFKLLTTKYRPSPDGTAKRRLSILLDKKVHSAPSINSVISERGQITGGFTRGEVDELVNTLTSGKLNYPLKDDVRSNVVDPTLGAEVTEKGTIAIMAAGILVVVFMVFYYRSAGIVADICLALNIFLVLGVMCFVQATFTLPGLAGIVLTIGMAVDANVLIFERIREERLRGSSLRMSIQNGFDKAFTTIIDANLTTLITAVVLYVIGTDQVKGFAVTLFIGIVMSMFAALYFGRLVFEILERKRVIKDLRFHSIVKEGGTNWNFIGKRKVCGIISICVIAVGMASFVARGKDNLDIDFTGGARVSFEFIEEQDLDEVREKLAEQFPGQSIAVERLRSIEGESGDSVKRFRLLTRENNVRLIKDNINNAFKDSNMALRTVDVKVDSIGVEDGRTVATIKFTTDGGKADKRIPLPTARTYVVSVLSGQYDSLLSDLAKDPASEAKFKEFLADADGKIRTINTKQELDGEKKIVKTYGEDEVVAMLVEVDGVGDNTSSAGAVGTKLYSTYKVRFDPKVTTSDIHLSLFAISQKLSAEPFFPEEDTFGTAVGGEMQQAAIMAMIVSLLAIVAYVWFRFHAINFGIAAVVALAHDVLVVLGLVAACSLISGNPVSDLFLLDDFKINLPMVAAFLTIVGYSLNDTIVVFDRIREVRGKNPAMTSEMINKSLNQTLSRTLLTSITTLLVVMILYIFGGEGIHGFAFCLVLGVIVGTYSSIFVASPVLLWLMNRPSAAGAGRPVTAPKPTS